MANVSQAGLCAAATRSTTTAGSIAAFAAKPGVGSRHALYIDSPIYGRAAYGPQHPLAIARTETVGALCRLLGWLPDSGLCRSSPASRETLRRFHRSDYLSALQVADETGRVARDARNQYGIGTMENPLFAGVFERAATTVGGSILAAELALEGRIVYHPAGGTHHGRPDRASGFCYFNDPVFALLTLLDAGLERILYVDLDAHHGDGVEDAFRSDARVHLVSIHEAGRWPYTGEIVVRPRQKKGQAPISSARLCNLPVPKGCNDSEFEFLMDNVVLPFAAGIEPEALVITCGADALAGDPLSTMCLSNTALWQAVERLAALAPPVVVLGGGGYNPWTVARCWAGLWARLADFGIPDVLPDTVRQILRALECDLVDEEDIVAGWLTSIADQPNYGAVRGEIRSLARYYHD